VTARSSCGDGRRMTIKEAVERRARMIRFHGSLELAFRHGRGADALMRRDWNEWTCRIGRLGVCQGDAIASSDVAWIDNRVTAACPACRSAA
jgi:hypothetical protein